MKSQFIINIETPDKFNLESYDGEDKPTEKEEIEFSKEWHTKIKDFFYQFNGKDIEEVGSLSGFFEEHYNEDGELPDHTVTIQEFNLEEKKDNT